MAMRSIILGAAALAGSVLAGPAAAQLRPLLDPPASADAARGGVEVFVLNETATAQPARGPAEIETTARDGTRLRLVAAADDPAVVAPGGFARVRYRLAASYPLAELAAVAAPARAVVTPGTSETESATSAGIAAAFVDRLHPYEPVYGAFGLNDAGAKLQLSLDFRLLGRDDAPHLDFAYTQTMFWALDEPSGPFRATTYSPELFAELPVDATATIGLGYRHDSNGGGVATSIDVNRFSLRASKAFALGEGWQLTLNPQAWVYVGDQGVAPDLERYWGNTLLSAAIDRADGLKLAVVGRGNVRSRKGAVEAFLSYPVARLGGSFPHLYLFGQVFSGYGEALSDYNKRATHARLGIALTR